MIENIGRKSALVVLAATAVAACGGGGGGGGDSVAGIDGTGAPSAPTPATATSAYGTITAFGSVYVNGVRFDTSSSSFEIDGEPGSQDDLSVGDVVFVRGSLDSGSSSSGTATTVVFDDAVEGPVQGEPDLVTGTLVVLGQTVRVGANTAFDDSFADPSLAGIAEGAIVEVSGLRRSDGVIEATRIEPKPPGLPFETTGTVAGLDATGMRFEIAALVVDYSAAQLQDFDGRAIADGDLVEVKGAALSASGELLATVVELRSAQVAPDAGDRAEIEGFITRFVDSTDFDVAGVPVTVTSATRFEGGGVDDLGLDLKVEAEGTVDANGVLVATKIDIRRAAAVRVVATVDSVDAANDSFVVLGITVRADALTRLEDKRDASVPSFSVGDIAAGDYVEVRGTEFPAGSGEILAALIERDDADTDTELQGFVTEITEPAFEILGVNVTTSAATTQFRAANEAPISSAEFFGALNVGSLVKVDGLEVADREIEARQAEFETE